MAKTNLPIQVISRSGLTPVFTAANVDGHTLLNDGKTYLEVKNGGGSAVQISFLIQDKLDGVAPANGGKQVSLPAGQDGKYGPFPTEIYNKANNTLEVEFGSVAGVTVGAFRLGG